MKRLHSITVLLMKINGNKEKIKEIILYKWKITISVIMKKARKE